MNTADRGVSTFGDTATTVTLWLPYSAPNLNDLIREKGAAKHARVIRACRPMKRTFDGYNALKSQWATRVQAHCIEQRLPRGAFEHGAHVGFLVVEENKRRDPDNFCSGSSKLILDGLVKCGVLRTDSWEGVLSLSYAWEIGSPGVLVTLSSAPLVARRTA